MRKQKIKVEDYYVTGRFEANGFTHIVMQVIKTGDKILGFFYVSLDRDNVVRYQEYHVEVEKQILKDIIVSLKDKAPKETLEKFMRRYKSIDK